MTLQNFDGKNDVFQIQSFRGAEAVQWMVFDRWGDKLFEAGSFNDSWDGTNNGKPLPVGGYILVIEAINAEGETFMENGMITLVR